MIINKYVDEVMDFLYSIKMADDINYAFFKSVTL